MLTPLGIRPYQCHVSTNISMIGISPRLLANFDIATISLSPYLATARAAESRDRDSICGEAVSAVPIELL